MIRGFISTILLAVTAVFGSSVSAQECSWRQVDEDMICVEDAIGGQTCTITRYWAFDCGGGGGGGGGTGGGPGDGGGGPGGGPGPGNSCVFVISPSINAISGGSGPVASAQAYVAVTPSDSGYGITFSGPGAGSQTNSGVGSATFSFAIGLDAVPVGGGSYSLTAAPDCGAPPSTVSATIYRSRNSASGSDSMAYSVAIHEGVVIAVNVAVQATEQFDHFGSSPTGSPNIPFTQGRESGARVSVTPEEPDTHLFYATSLSHAYQPGGDSDSMSFTGAESPFSFDYWVAPNRWYDTGPYTATVTAGWVYFDIPAGIQIGIPIAGPTSATVSLQ